MGLAWRSVTSTAWNLIVNFVRMPIALIQSIILARLLPVEYFGIVAGMVAVVRLSAIFFEFGFNGAYLHRAPETQDEEHATAVMFSLRIVFFTIWLVGLLVFATFFLEEIRQDVLIVLAFSTYFLEITNVARDVLIRRVQHKRIAILDLTLTIIVFVITVLVAVTTHSIWALLVVNLLSPIITALMLIFWKPVWRPRLDFDRTMVKYYLNFGSRVVSGEVLGVALDKVDDLWTNIFLGDRALGYYSRAYQFALYPRIILAIPVNTVTSGTYAELKYDRRRLSQAFFQVNSLLVRSGFLLAGVLAVIAPEFIRIFLGVKWMPMLEPFRLMLVYTLFDPIKLTIASVLVAVGKPEKVSIARTIQLLIMVVGLFVLGSPYGISGVALAVDLMLVAGIAILLYFVGPYVDYSFKRLFGVPILALAAGIGITWLINALWDQSVSDWLSMIVKGAIFLIGYLGILFLLDGRDIIKESRLIISLMLRKPESAFSGGHLIGDEDPDQQDLDE